MKILIVNKFFYRKGGSETYLFALGDALKELGHDVIYFSMSHPNNLPCGQAEYFTDYVDYHARTPAINKLKIAWNTVYSKTARDRFEKLLCAEKPDIVHINNVHRQITLSILEPCKHHNVPVVATCHDWIYICPNYQRLRGGQICGLCRDGNFIHCFKNTCVHNSKLKSLLAVWEALFYRLRRSYNLIDLYIAPSEYMASEMRAARFTEGEIILMRNFLPIHKILPVESSDIPYFLYSGRLIKEKGVETLVRAYAAVQPKSDLYMLGDGPMRRELEEMSHRLAPGRIHFIGMVHGEKLYEYIGRSFAIVIPSELPENCPYSIIEGMSAGKPIIASRIGGLPELVEDGKSGFCYNAKDAVSLGKVLLRLENLSEKEYNRMSEYSRVFARQTFSKKDYMRELISRYEGLISKAMSSSQKV